MKAPIELNWTRLFIDDVSCYLAVVDGGYLVASDGRPRFCFFGETESIAVAKVRRGLQFYREGQKSPASRPLPSE